MNDMTIETKLAHNASPRELYAYLELAVREYNTLYSDWEAAEEMREDMENRKPIRPIGFFTEEGYATYTRLLATWEKDVRECRGAIAEMEAQMAKILEFAMCNIPLVNVWFKVDESAIGVFTFNGISTIIRKWDNSICTGNRMCSTVDYADWQTRPMTANRQQYIKNSFGHVEYAAQEAVILSARIGKRVAIVADTNDQIIAVTDKNGTTIDYTGN